MGLLTEMHVLFKIFQIKKNNFSRKSNCLNYLSVILCCKNQWREVTAYFSVLMISLKYLKVQKVWLSKLWFKELNPGSISGFYMPVVFSYKLQYFKAGAFAYGDFLIMFPISILEISAIPAKQTNFLNAYAMWRTLKYSMLHSTEKKILEEKKNKNNKV